MIGLKKIILILIIYFTLATCHEVVTFVIQLDYEITTQEERVNNLFDKFEEWEYNGGIYENQERY